MLLWTHLSISIEGKRPTRVILENHGRKFTHSWEMAIKPTCVCVFVCVCVLWKQFVYLENLISIK
jgi:hypothetical protein